MDEQQPFDGIICLQLEAEDFFHEPQMNALFSYLQLSTENETIKKRFIDLMLLFMEIEESTMEQFKKVASTKGIEHMMQCTLKSEDQLMNRNDIEEIVYRILEERGMFQGNGLLQAALIGDSKPLASMPTVLRTVEIDKGNKQQKKPSARLREI
jgi:hypothetical protein